MRLVWLTVLSSALVFSLAASAKAQLMPRRNTTRPCPTHKLPLANYEVNLRSSSVVLLSNRFVYFDDPLEVLNRQLNVDLKQTTRITSITTEKEIFNGPSKSLNGQTGITTDIAAGISAIGDARLAAQEQLLKSDKTPADISAAISVINDARLLTQERLLKSGRTATDISAVISAMDFARLLEQERLLASVNSPASKNAFEAARSLALDKLVGSGTTPAMDAIQLRSQERLLNPGKTTDKITKKTQIFNNTPAIHSATMQRDKKLFQWREDKMQIDHCEISNMAFQISRNGDWVLNLRADQNRVDPNRQFNPTLHIRRNKFGVVLRCYGNLFTAPVATGIRTGKPVMAEIEVEKFWVQNGRPKFLVTSNNEPLIVQHFDSIDRVEIEFFYFK